MPRIEELVQLLLTALHDEGRRQESIRQLQSLIWNTPESPGEHPAWGVLGDLATDLDYYEPDRRRRGEAPVFLDDSAVEEVLRKGLQDLIELGVPIERTT